MNGTCQELPFDNVADFQQAINADIKYRELMQAILKRNYMKNARGHDRYSIPAYSVTFPDINCFIPAVRGKKLFLLMQLREMLWFLSGSTNVDYLIKHGVHIWDNWVPAKEAVYENLSWGERLAAVEKAGLMAEFERLFGTREDPLAKSHAPQNNWMAKNDIPRRKLIGGKLGPVYGAQWRAVPDTQMIFTGDESEHARYQQLKDKGYTQIGIFDAGETGYDNVVMRGYIDQLGNALDLLDSDPGSARMVVNAWNPQSLPDMALPPCHMMFQFIVGGVHPDAVTIADHVLHMNVYQRSADVPIGVTFNWASYGTLLKTIAACSRIKLLAGSMQYNMGDCHVYRNQMGAPLDKLMNQLDTVIAKANAKETFLSAMADTPSLKICVPESLRSEWEAGKWSTRQRLDSLVNHCLDLSDADLLKVFEYHYDNFEPYINFPVSV